VNRVGERVREAVWGPETGARLYVAHVLLSVLIGTRIVFGPYRQLAHLPHALFEPVPLLGFLPNMPPLAVIAGLQVVGGLAALAAALRKRPRLAFALAWGCYLVLAGLRGSRGKVLHNDLLLLWTSVPFLFAKLDVSLRDRTPRRDTGWTVRTAIAIATLVYFFAGYHKVRRSGIDWAIGDNVRYVMLWGPSVGKAAWEGLAHFVADHAWAYRSIGAMTLVFELTMPLAAVKKKLAPLYGLVAVGLHVATYLVLGLDYWAWACTVLILFYDWPDLLDRWRRRRSGAQAGPRSEVGCSPVAASIDPHTEVSR
jgi:hypothetical protein